MKDPILVGENIHEFLKILVDEGIPEIQQSMIDAITHGTGIVIVSSRGTGKRSIQHIVYEKLLSDSFKDLERRANLMVLDDVIPEPRPRIQLTDYDPRGTDRIKGPKGPRTKWGKIK